MLCYHTEVVKANSNEAQTFQLGDTKQSGLLLGWSSQPSKHIVLASFYVSTNLWLLMMMSITQFPFFHQVSKATLCNLRLGWLQLFEVQYCKREFNQFLGICTLHQNPQQKQYSMTQQQCKMLYFIGTFCLLPNYIHC